MGSLLLTVSDRGGPAAVVRSGTADVAIEGIPFDQRGLDIEVLLTEPMGVLQPTGHRLARRRRLCRADLADESMPRWKGQADPAVAACWSGTDTPPRPAPGPAPAAPGLEVSDRDQFLDAVALGQAVA